MLWRGCWVEALRTLALGQVVLDLATGIGATDVLPGARVSTLVVNTAFLSRAVSVGAAAQQTHAIVAGLIDGTL